jgi:hypothetical protein
MIKNKKMGIPITIDANILEWKFQNYPIANKKVNI